MTEAANAPDTDKEPPNVDIFAALMSLNGRMLPSQTNVYLDETKEFSATSMGALESRIERVELNEGGGGAVAADTQARLDELTKRLEKQRSQSQRQERNHKSQMEKPSETAAATAAAAAAPIASS